MKASELDPSAYHSFPEFAQHDLPLELIDASLLITLQSIRDKTGIPIYPSPIASGWARTSGSSTSRHYAAGRLSDAGDVFPAKGRCLELWLRLQTVSNVGAIGIYADTDGPDGTLWPMIHLDLRESRLKLLWARDGDYYYLPQDQVAFWQVVNEIIRQEEQL